MRKVPAIYLEEAKIDELAEKYRREGYRVDTDALVGDQRFDLLAQRDGKRLLFEVKARSRLKESADQLTRLRRAALAVGADEFRLVVVNPPREIEVTIEGLDLVLAEFLKANPPDRFDELSALTSVERVSIVELDAVDARRSGLHVRGWAGMRIELNWGLEEKGGPMTLDDSLPFAFDVDLHPDLTLAKVNEITVDYSSFLGPEDEADEEPVAGHAETTSVGSE